MGVGFSVMVIFFQIGTGLTHAIEDGTSAIHLKAVVRPNMCQQLLADTAVQMDQLPAGDALQMEMSTAIPLSQILVDVGGLGIASVFSGGTLVAKAG